MNIVVNQVTQTGDVKEQRVEIVGVVERVLFANAQTGFTVCYIKPEGQVEKVTACGLLSTVHQGNIVQATGCWVQHPKFGRQFSVDSYSISLPSSAVGIEKYLASGLIKGIGPTYAQRLVSFFGTRTLEVIDKTPEQLASVPGIGPKRQKEIIAGWAQQKEVAHIMVFLQEKGVSSTYAVKIYKAYKQQAIELMLENPYRIAEDIWGIGFAIADTIAQKLSVAPDSVKRFRAALLHVLSTSTQNGHVYVELESLKKATAELLSLDVTVSASKVKIVLHDLYNEEKIKLVSKGQEHFIALAFHYKAEKGIADLLLELQKATSFLNVDQNKLYELLRTDQKNGAQLHEQQQKGIMSVFTSNVTIITGGPGTGKTTLVKSVLNLCDQFAVSYKLAAPTGRAAKRLTQSANRQAVTLHRLLEFDPATMQFTKNAQNALDCKLLVVDEASMIDIFLMYALLKAVARGTHLVFIGDVDQLPSVGSGNVLCDLIESDLIPTVRLTHIFRQAHESLIVTNAHRINKGEFFVTFDETTPHAKDFYFIKEENPDTIQEHLRHVFKSVLVQKKIALDATAVLVPMNRGSVGTVALNQMLQNLLNPRSDDAIVYGSYTFKVSDRVMQIRNNYDKHVFNGDIGTVVLIDKNEKELHVQFDQLVVYDFSELDELVLAYAISIHKSQGSEYDAVIIPLFMQHYTLLQRKLLYTAVTRAKKICILIGQPKAFWTAIRNSVTQVRLTLLKDFLASNLSAR